MIGKMPLQKNIMLFSKCSVIYDGARERTIEQNRGLNWISKQNKYWVGKLESSKWIVMQLLSVTSIGSCFYMTTVRPCLLYGVECWKKQEAAAVLVENVCRRPKTAPLKTY